MKRPRMRAVIAPRYGPPEVLRVGDAPRPTAGPGEVLVRVRAATAATADWRIRRGDNMLVRLFFGLLRPRHRIPGFELSGVVEETGAGVERFAPGDQVFGLSGMAMGAYADFVRLPEKGQISLAPRNLPLEEAAALPIGATTAIFFLRAARLRAGQRVLVWGASSSVGTYALQLVRYFGAEADAVSGSRAFELATSLGARRTFDYAGEEVDKAGRAYDVVFDCVGKLPVGRGLKLLKRGGAFVTASGYARSSALQRLWAGWTRAISFASGLARSDPGDLSFFRTLVESGELRPVIDRRFGLDEIVEAHRYAEAGHKTGNVLVLVEPDAAQAAAISPPVSRAVIGRPNR